MTNAVRTDIKRVLLANVKDAPYGLLRFHRQTDNDIELLYECGDFYEIGGMVFLAKEEAQKELERRKKLK